MPVRCTQYSDLIVGTVTIRPECSQSVHTDHIVDTDFNIRSSDHPEHYRLPVSDYIGIVITYDTCCIVSRLEFVGYCPRTPGLQSKVVDDAASVIATRSRQRFRYETPEHCEKCVQILFRGFQQRTLLHCNARGEALKRPILKIDFLTNI